MRLLAVALPAAATAGFFLGIRAETPWFSPRTDDFFSVASSTATLNPGQSIVVATVPRDKRLVLTDAGTREAYFGPGVTHTLQLEQHDVTGKVSVAVPMGFLQLPNAGFGDTGHSDGHGIVFAPGSDIVISSDSGAPGPVAFSYFLVGYFTDR